MAVKIPIVTVFDSKGLKQAQYQLNKVRGNFQNLGRNFALAGAAFAGAAAVIGKSARDLARIESINAQTAQTIKSMGNAANISAKQVETLAGSLEAMTATEAEAIQEGANLLLTFGNITNQLGKGNDIFNQTTAIMVDMGVALKKGPVDTATMLGKALNDPIRGMTALRRVGVSFTDQQVEQVKALQKSGDLMGAQKLILAELQNQYGGSGAAFAATFAGQVQLLNHELGALGEEATLIVMPALREMVSALRELAPEIGAKMKTAIAAVDWKAFTKTIVDLITFLVQNAETIMKVVGAIYLLNTAYNLGKIAVGLYKAATIILDTTLKTTTTSAKLLRGALLLTGVAAAVFHVGETYKKTKEEIQKTTPALSDFNTEAISVSKAVAEIDPVTKAFHRLTEAILDAILANHKFNNPTSTPKAGRTSVMDDYNYNLRTGQPVPGAPSGLPSLPNLASIASGGGGAGAAGQSFSETLKREGVLATRETKLLATGVSSGLANMILGTATTKKTFQAELKKLTSSTKAVEKVQAKFNKTAAGRAELASVAAAAESAAAAAAEQAAAAAAAAAQAAAEAAAREAAILAEKQRVYESFAYAVTSTFGQIKDAILGAFTLPSLGGSTDSIIRNMDKLLTRVKAFSSNITKLSSMGLDPKLLQQVINAGPIAGAKLAANLVSGGIGGLNAINQGYAELGNVAGEIGMTGTQALFGTQAQQTIYNVNINGGLDSGASIGKAVVDAVRAYERTSGPVWQGA
jgi:hypothetical protein